MLLRSLIVIMMSAVLFSFGAVPSAQADSRKGVIFVHGNESTPVVVEEFISLTCNHCARFFVETVPQLEPYVKEGKVRFETHIYVRDDVDLKAASLAFCMPDDKYMPFLKVLFENQTYWSRLSNPDETLIRYAKLGGLDEAKAKQCINDDKISLGYSQDRDFSDRKHSIQGTPTLIFNNGAQTLMGFQDAATVKDVIDRILAKK